MLKNDLLPAACEKAKLVSLLADNNQSAFQSIYDKYRHRVYHVALRYLKSAELAQEVVQDVFLKLWTERKRLNPDAPVEAWLYTVAKNNTLNRLKKIAVEDKAIQSLKHTAKQRNDYSTQDGLKESDCQRLLNEALQSLSTNQLKVYRLAREESLSHLQIAEHLNISPLTVKTHMSRALGHLKLFFANR
jgi:RNA polymerase sigma-70 factor (ECF subfamily)